MKKETQQHNLKHNNSLIRRAYRTPPSVTFDIENLNNAVSWEADRNLLDFVVWQEQRLFEALFNNCMLFI